MATGITTGDVQLYLTLADWTDVELDWTQVMVVECWTWE